MLAKQKDEDVEIVVQSMLLPNRTCDKWEMYFRAQEKELVIQSGNALTLKGTTISTNTYMNSFDMQMWSEYTGIQTYKLIVEVCGKGHLRVYSLDKKTMLAEHALDAQTMQTYSIEIHANNVTDIVYFEIESQETLEIRKAVYIATLSRDSLNTVHLDLNICTYKRKKEVIALLNQLEKSLFFEKSSKLYGALSIRIIDNASELTVRDDQYIKIYHNPNTGGSGGFSRGILESRKEIEQHKTSHIIFMDDDVQILNETLYKVYALLRLVKEEYKNRVVAGRMFRMNQKHIQYTASEIWNAGNIAHIGENQDMCKVEHLKQMNHRLGEYTGWWFGCFPIDFAKKELPLPFFLHCDDVEYGLRFGSSPLLMNGIQVWHETFENRISPTILYYDIRNSLIVNTIYGYFTTETDAWNWWKQRLWSFSAYVAMTDYLKGKLFFEKHTERKQFMQMHKITFYMLKPFLWRLLWFRFKKRGKTAFQSYKAYL
jgi:Predicted glycosyltransferases